MLRRQAHLQVTQKTNTQPKTWTKSLPAPPHGKDNAQLLTAAHTPLPAWCFIGKILVNLNFVSLKKNTR